ncbi:helix-turn-helix domain-containing protein [Paraburkholderia fungorum]|uniref:helix-turn-helix domain-containing protein n=1 Tax=Paraburkholderia fungorum TaxID=134537 RepID=UPI00402B0756
MMRTDKHSPTMKVLNVLDALAGYTVNGVANTVLAKQLGMTQSAITRAMQVLIDKGWARKKTRRRPTRHHVWGGCLAGC